MSASYHSFEVVNYILLFFSSLELCPPKCEEISMNSEVSTYPIDEDSADLK